MYFNPIINGNKISFELKKGTSTLKSWNNRGTITCPCCGSVTNVEEVKNQSKTIGLKHLLIGIVSEGKNGKVYSVPNEHIQSVFEKDVTVEIEPTEMMSRNSNGGDTFPWGIKYWKQLFSKRQMMMLNHMISNYKKELEKISIESAEGYNKAVITFLAIWIDRILPYNTSFGVYETGSEKVQRIFGRQAIPMNFDFPESNPFCESSGSALNQLDWLSRYFDSESNCPFFSTFANASSGDKQQYENKSITSVVTDPPYYDAIAYADISDFFYVWLKQTLANLSTDFFNTINTKSRRMHGFKIPSRW